MSHSVFNVVGLTPKFFPKRLTKFFRRHENDNSEFFADLAMNEQPYFKVIRF